MVELCRTIFILTHVSSADRIRCEDFQTQVLTSWACLRTRKRGENREVHQTVVFTGQHSVGREVRDCPCRILAPHLDVLSPSQRKSWRDEKATASTLCQIQLPALNKPINRAKFRVRSRKRKFIEHGHIGKMDKKIQKT